MICEISPRLNSEALKIVFGLPRLFVAVLPYPSSVAVLPYSLFVGARLVYKENKETDYGTTQALDVGSIRSVKVIICSREKNLL